MAFVAELIPLYPVYALLFAAAGLSSGQISLLFGLWSVTGFALEVPFGALADRIARRHLLIAAHLLRAAGFATWTLWPCFAGFAAGFVLWGAGGAAASGTWEAMLYEELDSDEKYVRSVGRLQALDATGSLVGSALAAPLISVGGYAAAGWVSVAACLAAAGLAGRLPVGRPILDYAVERTTVGGYARTLHAGVKEALSDRSVGRLVLVGAVLSGAAAIEEYFALLVGGLGLPAGVLPLLLLLPPVAFGVGAEAGGRLGGLSGRGLAGLAAAGGGLLAAGALLRHPLGFLGVALGYGVLECASLLLGARLQAALTGPRATVTSVSALAAEVVALLVFAAFGTLSTSNSLPLLVALSMLPVVGLALVLPRWLPRAEN